LPGAVTRVTLRNLIIAPSAGNPERNTNASPSNCPIFLEFPDRVVRNTKRGQSDLHFDFSRRLFDGHPHQRII
jgi:hypothetical protein